MYIGLMKIKLSHLDLTTKQFEPDILLVPRNTDENINEKLCQKMSEGNYHRVSMPIVSDNSDHPILGTFVKHSTKIEIVLIAVL